MSQIVVTLKGQNDWNCHCNEQLRLGPELHDQLIIVNEPFSLRLIFFLIYDLIYDLIYKSSDYFCSCPASVKRGCLWVRAGSQCWETPVKVGVNRFMLVHTENNTTFNFFTFSIHLLFILSFFVHAERKGHRVLNVSSLILILVLLVMFMCF